MSRNYANQAYAIILVKDSREKSRAFSMMIYFGACSHIMISNMEKNYKVLKSLFWGETEFQDNVVSRQSVEPVIS